MIAKEREEERKRGREEEKKEEESAVEMGGRGYEQARESKSERAIERQRKRTRAPEGGKLLVLHRPSPAS